jgi:hypothetical protein
MTVPRSLSLVILSLVPAAPAVAQITGQARSVEAQVSLVDPITGTPLVDATSDGTTSAGQFLSLAKALVSLPPSTAQAEAFQASDVILGSHSILASASVVSCLAVDSAASTSAHSLLRVDFVLQRTGAVLFDGLLSTTDQVPGWPTFAAHGEASAQLRVVGTSTNQVLFSRLAQLGGPPVALTDLSVLLAPGAYFLELRLEALDGTTSLGGAPGAAAMALADVEGLIVEGPALVVEPVQLSLTSGGKQNLLLDAGPAYSGSPYLVLGSSTGTAPGVAVDAVQLPLNVDSYFLLTFTQPNQPPFDDTFGILDLDGRGKASLIVPPGLPVALLGTTLHHAYVTIGPSGVVEFASNAGPLQFLP